MSVKFSKQYFNFGKVLEMHSNLNEPKRSFATVLISSSWKDSNDKRHYSDWIARFKGKSLVGLEELKKGDFIFCDGSFTREPYEKEGKRHWGDASMTIFSCEKWVKQEQKTEEVDDEIPF